jgi:hypothetical protein
VAPGIASNAQKNLMSRQPVSKWKNGRRKPTNRRTTTLGFRKTQKSVPNVNNV